MTEFTIFTTCRLFKDELAEIQTQAIHSWTLLKPKPHIILIGDESGTGPTARKFDAQHVRTVACNRFGTPLLGPLFWTAQVCRKSEYLVYVNSDIILMQDFADALDAVAHKLKGFLMVGPRWDLQEPYQIDFDSSRWDHELRDMLKSIGKRHKPTGLDYFAFYWKIYKPQHFPPLAVGRTEWDAWLVHKAKLEKHPVVSAAKAVTVVHQWHPKKPPDKEEINLNRFYSSDRLSTGYVWDADYDIRPGGAYKLDKGPDFKQWWCEQNGWTGWE